MVRLNKDRGKTGVCNIDTKDDVIEAPAPKEPMSIPQSSNGELEKFAATVLKVMGDESVPQHQIIFKFILISS